MTKIPTHKNTVLLVEPRILPGLERILAEYMRILGTEKWHYVFYCGRDAIPHWKTRTDSAVEIRALAVGNFDSSAAYSDFMKQRWLWESLGGEFVLTVQADTWPLGLEPYSLDYFIGLGRSYIGGNMRAEDVWPQLAREGWRPAFHNFNGGLSLRRRADMVRVLENFIPQPTCPDAVKSACISTDAEDVYFTLGCHALGLPVGDDYDTLFFAIYMIFPAGNMAFGIHRPWQGHVRDFVADCFPRAVENNPYLFG